MGRTTPRLNEIELTMRCVEIETGREIETEAIQFVMADGSTFQILKDDFEGEVADLGIGPKETNLVAMSAIEKRRCPNGRAAGEKIVMKKYVVLAALCLLASTAGADPFEKNLGLQGLTFHVESQNDSSTSRLRLSVDGLKEPTSAIEREIDGTVVGAEIADLDVNGFPEIYVFTQSAGSGSYGNVVAYASNKNRSITEIFLSELKKRDAKGYRGHDEFAVVKPYLVRRFPIYRAEDANATPTGGRRQLQYRLRPGKAGWTLRQVKTTEFPAGR